MIAHRSRLLRAAECSHVRESLYRNHATINQLENAQRQFICFCCLQCLAATFVHLTTNTNDTYYESIFTHYFYV